MREYVLSKLKAHEIQQVRIVISEEIHQISHILLPLSCCQSRVSSQHLKTHPSQPKLLTMSFIPLHTSHQMLILILHLSTPTTPNPTMIQISQHKHPPLTYLHSLNIVFKCIVFTNVDILVLTTYLMFKWSIIA